MFASFLFLFGSLFFSLFWFFRSFVVSFGLCSSFCLSVFLCVFLSFFLSFVLSVFQAKFSLFCSFFLSFLHFPLSLCLCFFPYLHLSCVLCLFLSFVLGAKNQEPLKARTCRKSARGEPNQGRAKPLKTKNHGPPNPPKHKPINPQPFPTALSPHLKTWGSLCRCVQVGGIRFLRGRFTQKGNPEPVTSKPYTPGGISQSKRKLISWPAWRLGLGVGGVGFGVEGLGLRAQGASTVYTYSSTPTGTPVCLQPSSDL